MAGCVSRHPASGHSFRFSSKIGTYPSRERRCACPAVKGYLYGNRVFLALSEATQSSSGPTIHTESGLQPSTGLSVKLTAALFNFQMAHDWLGLKKNCGFVTCRYRRLTVVFEVERR
jgi:hypothetical protein